MLSAAAMCAEPADPAVFKQPSRSFLALHFTATSPNPAMLVVGRKVPFRN